MSRDFLLEILDIPKFFLSRFRFDHLIASQQPAEIFYFGALLCCRLAKVRAFRTNFGIFAQAAELSRQSPRFPFIRDSSARFECYNSKKLEPG